MPKKISHIVERSGRKPGDPDIEIPVAEDIASVPGSPVREVDVSYYSRVHPLEAEPVAKSADREWAWSVYTDEISAYRKQHNQRDRPHVDAAAASGDREPTGTPEPAGDVTEEIRRKARALGFGEVGFTKFDRRYVYVSKKRWVKFEHAICLAYEQEYERTQSAPSLEAEGPHFDTYRIMVKAGLELADHRENAVFCVSVD